jgi:hypothetical protein
MPELPEVETVRRVLIAGGIVGARIDAPPRRRLPLVQTGSIRRLCVLMIGSGGRDHGERWLRSGDGRIVG